MVMGSAVVSYNRYKVDSTHMGADRAFTNDKYWFLVPFQLVWDKTATISEPVKKESPLGKENLAMITITYPTEGGYRPGDAYDIFYDENFLIKEWSYRPKNFDIPYMSTTFENYQDFDGIKIAINHKKDDGKWNLNFTDVSITLE